MVFKKMLKQNTANFQNFPPNKITSFSLMTLQKSAIKTGIKGKIGRGVSGLNYALLQVSQRLRILSIFSQRRCCVMWNAICIQAFFTVGSCVGFHICSTHPTLKSFSERCGCAEVRHLHTFHKSLPQCVESGQP